MTGLRIYLADDHTMFRRSVSRVLKEFNYAYVIKEANNGKELLSLFDIEIPDVVILDLEMPVLNGFKTCDFIAREFPEVKIIVLSMYDSEDDIGRVMALGAHAFLSKDAEPEKLDEIIKKLTNEKAVRHDRSCPEMRNVIEISTGEKVQAKTKIELTPRESAIVSLLCREFTNKEIGHQLGLSQNTIRNHKARIMSKAGVKNTPGLVRMAYENRFLVSVRGS
ncbi:MAG TPA: response regulator transcription factor [Cyclobacteriaceae bacterium]|nr:response regulator transcription factor [Cyclobacteriaceae bacterium]